MQVPDYKDLYFGKSDARHELNESWDDFVRSFVDLNGSVDKIVSGSKFLILGPKGTGKSAVATYLEATGASSRSYFAKVRNASSLPLAEVPHLETGQSAGALRTYSAWKFIILANLLDVALTNTDADHPKKREVLRVIRTMREFGLIASSQDDSEGPSLRRYSGKKFVLSRELAGALFRDEIGGEVDIFSLTPYLMKWISEVRTSRRPILILDGLDSIFLNDSAYDESLAGLTQTVFDLNIALGAGGTSRAGVVLLMRNDIFSRVSLILPDAHKMRDFSFDLDWKILSGAADENAPLIRLVDGKATKDLGLDYDLKVLEYFPEEIEIGRKTKPRLPYLLNLTRHTPRDILQLLEYVRITEEAFGAPSAGGFQLTPEVIREGVIQYSAKYFVEALQGEFAGWPGGPAEARGALNALKLLDQSQFTRSDFARSLAMHAPGLEDKADGLLRMLFYAGALGNMFSNGAQRYLVFYHRRNDVELHLQGKLVLHNALTHAWSRQFGMSE